MPRGAAGHGHVLWFVRRARRNAGRTVTRQTWKRPQYVVKDGSAYGGNVLTCTARLTHPSGVPPAAARQQAAPLTTVHVKHMEPGALFESMWMSQNTVGRLAFEHVSGAPHCLFVHVLRVLRLTRTVILTRGVKLGGLGTTGSTVRGLRAEESAPAHRHGVREERRWGGGGGGGGDDGGGAQGDGGWAGGAGPRVSACGQAAGVWRPLLPARTS